MLRRGFTIADIYAHDGTLFLINSSRYLYRFEEGTSYDGAPIDAYWRTPLTDLQHKEGIKTLQELFLRGLGEGGGEGSVIVVDARVGHHVLSYRYLMPAHEEDVLEIPLKNEGRTFAFCFSNETGSRWRILGGVQLVFGYRQRTM